MPPSNHRVLKHCLDNRETGSTPPAEILPLFGCAPNGAGRIRWPALTPISEASCGLTEGARVSAVAKPNDEPLGEISRCVDETRRATTVAVAL